MVLLKLVIGGNPQLQDKMSKLTSLPLEVVSQITKYISIEDFFNLCLTCRDFQLLLRGNSDCKPVIQVSCDDAFSLSFITNRS